MDYHKINDNELICYIRESNEEAHQMLFKKYKPLILSFAKRMITSGDKLGLELSDLIQEGNIALSEAIEHYNENKETLFYTYARSCVEKRMLTSLILASRQKHRILNDSISYESEKTNEMQLNRIMFDNSSNPEQMLLSQEYEEEFKEKAKKLLTAFEEQVFDLKLHFFTYKEIAEILDKDAKAIDNAVQRIRVKLQPLLSDFSEFKN